MLRRTRAFVPLLCAAVALAGAASLAARVEGARRGAPAERVEATVEGVVVQRRVGARDYRLRLGDLAAVPEREAGTRALPPRIDVYGERTAPGLPAFEARLPGQRVRARVRLAPLRDRRNPGGRDLARARAREGVGAQARLVHPALHVQIEAPRGVRERLETWRERRARVLIARGEGGALLAALALGRRDALAPESLDAFARLGIAHLLALSGLHLALVAGGVYGVAGWLLRRLPAAAQRGDPRRGAAWLALASAAVYALVAGFGVPLQRALLFLAALVAGFLVRRRLLPDAPLGAAALLVLIGDPAALFAPGAQLSFAASAALAMAARREARRRRAGAAIGSLAHASVVAIAATAPLAVFHFGRASLAGLLANLVAIPLTAAILLPLALASVALASVGAAGGALDALATLARALLATAERVAGALPAESPLPHPHAAIWVLAAALTLAILHARGLARRIALLVAQSALLAIAPAPELEPRPPRVVWLDVGHGDAVLVEGRHAAVLVDAGGRTPGGGDRGRDVVLPALAALGVRRLDVVVASHADLDHRGGLEAVLAALPVGRVWLPRASDPRAFDALRRAAAARGVPVEPRGLGDASLAIGDVVLHPLWPPARAARFARNDRSLVLRVDVARRRVLLPGDLERAGELALLSRVEPRALRAELLKLAHHGSRTSSSEAFLRAVSPRLAIASAACGGRFAMPHAEVRARVSRAGAALLSTGRDGAIGAGVGPALRVLRFGSARRCR